MCRCHDLGTRENLASIAGDIRYSPFTTAPSVATTLETAVASEATAGATAAAAAAAAGANWSAFLGPVGAENQALVFTDCRANSI